MYINKIFTDTFSVPPHNNTNDFISKYIATRQNNLINAFVSSALFDFFSKSADFCYNLSFIIVIYRKNQIKTKGVKENDTSVSNQFRKV